jgi:Pretoxin HINT domain
MIHAMLLCGVLLTGLPAADEPPVKPLDLEAYTAVKAKAPRTPDAQVKLALWCEENGLSAERTKHLMLATLLDPANTMARGLMGLVSYQGKWQAPAEVARQVQEDPARKALLKEYLQRRARAPDKPDDQWKLALWCEENGLKEQATAHLYQVLKRDPRRDAAWKRLGFKRIGGHWVKPEILAAEKAEAEVQSRGTRFWKPRLEKWRDALAGRDKARKAVAEAEISRITDRYAVPAVMTVFGHGNEIQQKTALRILGQIDSAAASRALAMLAVFSGSATIRGQSTEILRRRDVREFADFLISLVQQPIEFEVKRVGGPGVSGELFIKGQGTQPNVRRKYSPPAGPNISLQPGDLVVYDSSGQPVIRRPDMDNSATVWLWGPQLFNRALTASALGLIWSSPNPVVGEAQKQRVMAIMAQSGLGARAQQIGQQIIAGYQYQVQSQSPSFFYDFAAQSGLLAQPVNPGTGIRFTVASGVDIPVGRMTAEAQNAATAAEQQLERDVQSIRNDNSSIRELNDRVVPILQDVSGLDLGTRRREWQNWFVDQLGYQAFAAQSSQPDTVTEDVPLDYRPRENPLSSFIAPVAAQRFSCFGAGTPVQTMSGPRPIQELKIGDQVLTQSVKTGALDYHPVLLVHHNPPSRTFRVSLGDEVIVSSAFHRFWKAGQGWVMARDLAVGDPIRTLNGTIKVGKIEDGQVAPVFNLDIAAAADFFVGQSAALVHDNSLPDLRQPPFDGLLSQDSDPIAKPSVRPTRSTGSSRP